MLGELVSESRCSLIEEVDCDDDVGINARGIMSLTSALQNMSGNQS